MEYIPPRSKAEAAERFLEAVCVLKQEEAQIRMAEEQGALSHRERRDLVLQASQAPSYAIGYDLATVLESKQKESIIEENEEIIRRSTQSIKALTSTIARLGPMIPGGHLLKFIGLVSPKNPQVWATRFRVLVPGTAVSSIQSGGPFHEMLITTTTSEPSRIVISKREEVPPLLIVNRYSELPAWLPTGPAILSPGRIRLQERLSEEHFTKI